MALALAGPSAYAGSCDMRAVPAPRRALLIKGGGRYRGRWPAGQELEAHVRALVGAQLAVIHARRGAARADRLDHVRGAGRARRPERPRCRIGAEEAIAAVSATPP
jgi:hypothetical protein